MAGGIFPMKVSIYACTIDRSREIRRLDEKTRIPVMHDGVVKAMFKDYLGKTVIIEHEHCGSDTGRCSYRFMPTQIRAPTSKSA